MIVNKKNIETTLVERKGTLEVEGTVYRLYESRDVKSFRNQHMNRFYGLLRIAIQDYDMGALKNDQIFHVTIGVKTKFQICGYVQYGDDRTEIDFVITHIDTIKEPDHLWQIA